jgi:hypothetical protein
MAKQTYWGNIIGPFDRQFVCTEMFIGIEYDDVAPEALVDDEIVDAEACFEQKCAASAALIRDWQVKLNADPENCSFGGIDVDEAVDGTDFWVRRWGGEAWHSPARLFGITVTMVFYRGRPYVFK